MTRPKGPHMIKTGSSKAVMGCWAMATWCNLWAERDDATERSIDKVKCPVCVRNYRKANPAT